VSGDEQSGSEIEEPAADAAEASGPAAAEKAAADAAAPETGAMPPADFSTLILSLSTSALVHLGVVESPGGEPAPKSLPLAKHTIDLLTLLEEKTCGNLTGEEEQLLHQVLYDLRMRFIAATKG
jgi:hypothetical protein